MSLFNYINLHYYPRFRDQNKNIDTLMINEISNLMGYNPFNVIEYSIADFEKQFGSLKELLAYYIAVEDDELMNILLLVPQPDISNVKNQLSSGIISIKY